MKRLALFLCLRSQPSGFTPRLANPARGVTMKRRLWLLPLHMSLLIIPIFAILLALSAPAWAGLSRHDAAAAAQRMSNGRVLSVEKSEWAWGPVWRVKVVTPEGEVRIILIDASPAALTDS